MKDSDVKRNRALSLISKARILNWNFLLSHAYNYGIINSLKISLQMKNTVFIPTSQIDGVVPMSVTAHFLVIPLVYQHTDHYNIIQLIKIS